MMDFIFRILDALVACLTINLSWDLIMDVYWFLFFIEFPRYYLFDMIAAIRYGVTWRSRKNKQAVARRMLYIEKPLVTVLAPGKNEGKNIYKLVESLNEQTYKNFEIIIIDDGSDDATPQICADLIKAGHIHQFYRMRERCGKAAAANFGVSHASGKYIVHLDADSSLDRDAIEKILLPFYYDRNIKGVGGCIKVRNATDSICTAMQAEEYLRTIQVGRMVTDMLGVYHIISGAFGAFETEAIRQVGCWDIGPGLDGDITQKLRKAGYKVKFVPDAICMTNVPKTWAALFRQRRRWSKSLIRFRVRKHRDILWTGRNFSFSNMFSNLESILFDFVLNCVWLFYVINLVVGNVDRLLEIVIMGWLIRLSFSLTTFIVIQCVSERSREERFLLSYLPLHTFYMGYFLRIARLFGHIEELFFYSSYKDNWNPRKVSVVAQTEGL